MICGRNIAFSGGLLKALREAGVLSSFILGPTLLDASRACPWKRRPEDAWCAGGIAHEQTGSLRPSLVAMAVVDID